MIELSNSLADLAERIKETHAAVLVSQRTTADAAIKAGGLLVEAKNECKHGEWLPFLDRAGINERSARRYMTIWRSGLDRTLVADLGIKGTIAYLAARRLPATGQCLIVGRAPDATTVGSPIAFITPSTRIDGYFDITVYDPAKDEGEELVRPVLGQSIDYVDGTTFNAVWQAVDEMLPVPASERAFKLVWAADLEDDCAFLTDAEQRPGEGRGMPTSYLNAVEALEKCEEDFSPETFLAASSALSTVLRRMEHWPSDERMRHVYDRIASDEVLTKLTKVCSQKAIESLLTRRATS